MPMLPGLAQILLVGLVVYFCWLVLVIMRALTRPPRKSYAWALARNVPGDPGECVHAYSFESFELTGSRGVIEAWRVRGNAPDGPVVVMTHGWGSSKQGGLKRLDPFVDHARELILWDLPGHGDSAGTCALGSREHDDLQAVLHAIEPGAPIVLFGWSMGAGVCLRVGASEERETRIVGIVCESPYIHAVTPARNVIRLRGFPTRFNIVPTIGLLGVWFGIGPRWSGFARDELASRLGGIPLLVVHGTHDPVSPIADGEAIADASENASLVRIEEGGHNNLWTEPEFAAQMTEAIDSFFERIRSTG